MKWFNLLPVMLLTTVLTCLSCEDNENDDHKNEAPREASATFRKVDISGAKSLVLAASESSGSHALTRAEGDGNHNDGNHNDGDHNGEEHTEYNVQAPLYKVSDDGTMVEVNYTIEVVTEGIDEEGEKYKIESQLDANLRLKIQFIYLLSDKWLYLYNCSYDYPGYDDLPDGDFKAIVNGLINNGDNIGRNYLVRLEDGALFRLERGSSELSLGRAYPNSQEEVQGSVVVIGREIYYLDHNPNLIRVEDHGNTIDMVSVLPDNTRVNYILGTGSAMGIVPLYENGQESMFGLPSVVFPGANDYVPVSGVNLTDKAVQMFMVDNELYVARNEGEKSKEREFEYSDVYLCINGEELPMYDMSDDNSDAYGLFNLHLEAGTKVKVKADNGLKYRVFKRTDETLEDGAMVCTLIEENEAGSRSDLVEYEIPATDDYEFYVQIWTDYDGMMIVGPEGKTGDQALGYCWLFDRYVRGEESAFYKVEIGDRTAKLADEASIRYFGNTPTFLYGESDFESRHRRFITGGVVSWLDEQHNLMYVNCADLNTKTFTSKALPKSFPERITDYYNGVAYRANGNAGYYECSLATAEEKYVEFDFSELSEYWSRLAQLPSNAKFDPSLMAFTMTAFMIDGTKLTFYVDVEGENAGKARIYTTQAEGSGLVIQSLVRLN